MAHSLAKDAIYSEMNTLQLSTNLEHLGIDNIIVQSKAIDRKDYLLRPDKGRLLSDESMDMLQNSVQKPVDLCIIIADGLSANAVNAHSVKLIQLLLPLLKDWTFSPVILAKQGRVALSDPIGETLKARISLLLIGERPGLSSPDSMGAYITYQPKQGNTDEKRNCVSNIQPDGLSYEAAALKIAYLLQQMRTKQISGVLLKDDFDSRSFQIDTI
jgi:ethanolamine ammonia-lyase small subunit